MSNHDELMSNFFAQPDALAYGKVRLLACFFLFKGGDSGPNLFYPHNSGSL